MLKTSGLILTLILLFAGCFNQRHEKIKILQSNKTLDVDFKKTENKVFDISLGKNKQVLVLNFFTTSCGACKEEFGSLNSLKKEFGKKIKVLGILGEKVSKKAAKKFLKQYFIQYDVVLDPSSVGLFSSAVGDVFGVPSTYIFSKDGKLKDRFLGYVPHSTIRKSILKAL